MKEEELKQMDKEELLGVIKAQQYEIERLKSIIKEVREHIENKVMSSNEIIDGLKKIEVKELLEILDKENK